MYSIILTTQRAFNRVWNRYILSNAPLVYETQGINNDFASALFHKKDLIVIESYLTDSKYLNIFDALSNNKLKKYFKVIKNVDKTFLLELCEIVHLPREQWKNELELLAERFNLIIEKKNENL